MCNVHVCMTFNEFFMTVCDSSDCGDINDLDHGYEPNHILDYRKFDVFQYNETTQSKWSQTTIYRIVKKSS